MPSLSNCCVCVRCVCVCGWPSGCSSRYNCSINQWMMVVCIIVKFEVEMVIVSFPSAIFLHMCPGRAATIQTVSDFSKTMRTIKCLLLLLLLYLVHPLTNNYSETLRYPKVKGPGEAKQRKKKTHQLSLFRVMQLLPQESKVTRISCFNENQEFPHSPEPR